MQFISPFVKNMKALRAHRAYPEGFIVTLANEDLIQRPVTPCDYPFVLNTYFILCSSSQRKVKSFWFGKAWQKTTIGRDVKII
jgi:hypothetical protein